MTPYSAVFVPEHPESATELSLTSLSPLSDGIGSDWAHFSASGFLEVNPDTLLLASTFLDTDIEKNNAFGGCYSSQENQVIAVKPLLHHQHSSPTFKSFDLRDPSSREIKLGGVEEQKNIIKTSQPRVFQLDDAFIDFWSDSLLDLISVDWPTLTFCKFKSSLVPELTFDVA